MNRLYTYLVALVGVVCAVFIIRLFFFADLGSRTVASDVLQGFLVGFGLALVTAALYGRVRATRVDGWVTMFGCGVPGNGMFLRAAQAWMFPGPVAVPEEAMYWWSNTDGAGRRLDGRQDYVMHFPAGGLPPTDAFWSLTMADGKNRYVPNPVNRYHVGDRSGLVPNTDGSIDIYIQSTPPQAYESNWLPAPTTTFILWFRVYMPGAAILDRTYQAPPAVRAAGSSG
jgi:hypothetical protein